MTKLKIADIVQIILKFKHNGIIKTKIVHVCSYHNLSQFEIVSISITLIDKHQSITESLGDGERLYSITLCVCVSVCVCVRACVRAHMCVYVCVFVGSCLATKVLIGNLQASGRGWVITN